MKSILVPQSQIVFNGSTLVRGLALSDHPEQSRPRTKTASNNSKQPERHPTKIELATAEGVLEACKLATDLVHIGQYEEAAAALGWRWKGVGERPDLEGLSETTAAELLMVCGSLTGWLGSSKKIEGAQESAKDLISEAFRAFEAQGNRLKAAEAQFNISVCYWRLGALDESVVTLSEALNAIGDSNPILRAHMLIRRTTPEFSECRYYDALATLKEAEQYLPDCDDGVKARWHGQKALVLRRLAVNDNRPEYLDQAIIEFTAANYHFELSGNERFCGSQLNNLAMLLIDLGRYTEAHAALNRSHEIFVRLQDFGNLAQVRETRSRLFLAEGRYAEALSAIDKSIKSLEEMEENALLADALTIKGTILSRAGSAPKAEGVFRSAIEVGQDAGADESAAKAALSFIEELGNCLSAIEVYELYFQADDLLMRTQDQQDLARLRTCARHVLKRTDSESGSEEFSLPHAVRDFEARFIERALKQEGGRVSRAARRLGIKHQSLSHLLETRHRHLLAYRTPAIPRKTGGSIRAKEKISEEPRN